jgi:hypothetical protein
VGKRIRLENSPTGVQHSIDIDPDGNGFTSIEYTPGHVEKEILDSCHAIRDLRQPKTASLRFAARTPIGLHQIWRKEWEEKYRDTWTWMTFKVMKLNSRDFENLRTGGKDGKAMKL